MVEHRGRGDFCMKGRGTGMVKSEGMKLGFGMRLVFLPPFILREISELG